MTKEETARGGDGARLLVVDDEPTQREMLSGILERAGYRVETAAGGREALEALERDAFDLLLTDQKMPGMDGLALLDRVQAMRPDLPVVLMTAYGSVSDAVAAMKKGAADYLTKPFEREELLLVLEKALKQRRLEEEVVTLRGALRERYRLGNIIGASPAMREVFSLIERIAATDVPVLILGESGTGKELVARAIHGRSRRASGPFVALNCAAVPETLLESEFFGHERGAFTGAVRAHPGRFEQAAGGTLFLDEIGAMRTDLQAKLLRAIQEKEIQRLGSTVTTTVDVRILAATGENLEEAIRRKTLPRGPLLPAQRGPPAPAAAAGAGGGHPAARQPLPREGRGALRQGAAGRLAGGDGPAPDSIPGSATCGSWRTASSGWCSWRGGPASRRRTSRPISRRGPEAADGPAPRSSSRRAACASRRWSAT